MAWGNVQRAEASMAAESFEDAEAEYTEALEVDPSCAAAYLGRASARKGPNLSMRRGLPSRIQHR